MQPVLNSLCNTSRECYHKGGIKMFEFTRIAEENREAFEALLPKGFKSKELESFGLLGLPALLFFLVCRC